VVAKARAAKPDLAIIARAHSDEEVAYLKLYGANLVIMGEEEIAKAMIAQIADAAGTAPAT
jgi:CPA2 family monovalent cation:H+ antiporter-2